MQAGKFKAKAIDVGLGMTGTGKEQIGVLFEVTEDGECLGHVITWYGYFTEETTSRTIDSLRNCGWTGDDLSVFCADLRPAEMTVETLLPNEVQIVVQQKKEPRDGKFELEVRWVNKLGNGIAMKDKLDASAARAFAARMKGACKAIPAKAPASAPAQRQPPRTNNKPMREMGDDGDEPPDWLKDL